MTRNCQPVTIRAGSKGHDSELPASYHRGTTLIGQAEKKQLMGSGENVAESAPHCIDSYSVFFLVFFCFLLTMTFISQCCMGQEGPSVPWHMVHLNNDMI